MINVNKVWKIHFFSGIQITSSALQGLQVKFYFPNSTSIADNVADFGASYTFFILSFAMIPVANYAAQVIEILKVRR